MNYIPVKNPDHSRVYRNELRLDALFRTLGNQGYNAVIEEAELLYTNTLASVELKDAKVQLSVFSAGETIESEIL